MLHFYVKIMLQFFMLIHSKLIALWSIQIHTVINGRTQISKYCAEFLKAQDLFLSIKTIDN